MENTNGTVGYVHVESVLCDLTPDLPETSDVQATIGEMYPAFLDEMIPRNGLKVEMVSVDEMTPEQAAVLFHTK